MNISCFHLISVPYAARQFLFNISAQRFVHQPSHTKANFRYANCKRVHSHMIAIIIKMCSWCHTEVLLLVKLSLEMSGGDFAVVLMYYSCFLLCNEV